MCLCSRAQISRERGFRARNKIHQAIQRPAGVDDVFHQQDVLSLELGLRIVHQPDVAARDRRVTVARRDQKVDVQRPIDLADQVAQKDEASLQQPQHEQITVGIRRGDLRAELPHSRRDLRRVIDDAAQRSSLEPRISRWHAHKGSDEAVVRTVRLPRRCGALLESRRSSPPARLPATPPGRRPSPPPPTDTASRVARPWAPDGASRSPARHRRTTIGPDASIAALQPSASAGTFGDRESKAPPRHRALGRQLRHARIRRRRAAQHQLAGSRLEHPSAGEGNRAPTRRFIVNVVHRVSSAPVERESRRAPPARPTAPTSELAPCLASSDCGNDDRCTIGLPERQPRVHERLDLRSPARRTTRRAPSSVSSIDGSTRRIAGRMSWRTRFRRNARLSLLGSSTHDTPRATRVRLERAPPQLEERARDRTRRGQRRQSARPAPAQLAHQHRLDLIVARVRRRRSRAPRARAASARKRCRASRHIASSPFRADRRRVGQPAGHHREPSPARLARDQPAARVACAPVP